MNAAESMEFSQGDLAERLSMFDDTTVDRLQFGVIGFDAQTIVHRYNEFESRLAGLPKARVIGHHFFTSVAPCMNNFMVAQRFEDAWASGATLDATIDYVLTLRMKPVKVKLRLLASPSCPLSYVLLQRPQVG